MEASWGVLAAPWAVLGPSRPSQRQSWAFVEAVRVGPSCPAWRRSWPPRRPSRDILAAVEVLLEPPPGRGGRGGRSGAREGEGDAMDSPTRNFDLGIFRWECQKAHRKLNACWAGGVGGPHYCFAKSERNENSKFPTFQPLQARWRASCTSCLLACPPPPTARPTR